MVYAVTAVVTGLLIGQVLAQRVNQDPLERLMVRIAGVQARLERLEREAQHART